MGWYYSYVVTVFLLGAIFGLSYAGRIDSWQPLVPPSPRYAENPKLVKESSVLTREATMFSTWTPESDTNVWENSGLLEGDIMTYDETKRNGILNMTMRWPNATVPFFIDQKDFDIEEIITILKGFQEYHNRTCMRFRPYRDGDLNWVVIKGNYSGCWSSVGMREEGQVLNLQTPNCVRHGVVLHELLHAVGFYHQQSASDRDEYVKILWDNILDGREYNFNKYNDSVVTDYGVGYDYASVMHYSGKAFSKNGEPTIEPLKKDIEQLGQRKGFTDSDVKKLNKMYEDSCNSVEESEESTEKVGRSLDELIEFFESSKELKKK